MDGQTDGQIGGWVDGRTDGCYSLGCETFSLVANMAHDRNVKAAAPNCVFHFYLISMKNSFEDKETCIQERQSNRIYRLLQKQTELSPYIEKTVAFVIFVVVREGSSPRVGFSIPQTKNSDSMNEFRSTSPPFTPFQVHQITSTENTRYIFFSFLYLLLFLTFCWHGLI